MSENHAEHYGSWNLKVRKTHYYTFLWIEQYIK